ncbi:hypothetical protein F2P56_036982 [Juglans regia]|nr:hypothetical protein F2P56_036982 [Juglans regia]
MDPETAFLLSKRQTGNEWELFLRLGLETRKSLLDNRRWKKFRDHIPAACKDSMAILFMFDLTSWCTLNGCSSTSMSYKLTTTTILGNQSSFDNVFPLTPI